MKPIVLTTDKRAVLARFLPSMTDMAFLMPLVFLFGAMGGAHTLLSDGDTGWHLRTGEWILTHGRVPDRDIFSFTRSGEPWFAWEWLWDLTFGWLHLHAGMQGVLLASSLILALTFALLFRLARWTSGNALAALAVTIVAAASSAGHWLARPHLFTMLFTVVFYGVLEWGDRQPDPVRARKLLWLLPPLTVLWTNLHGGFFVGLTLIAAYAAGQFAVLLRQVAPEARRAALASGRTYLVTGAGCFLATFVNPYSYRLHEHIIRYLSDGFLRGNITEFQSLSFQTSQARFFEILLLLSAGAAFWQLRRGRVVWPLLFVGWAHLALYSARNIEIFALLAAPPAAEVLAAASVRARKADCVEWLAHRLEALQSLTRELTALDRIPRCYAASLAAAVMLASALYAPGVSSRYRAEFDPKSFPVAAAKRLDQAGLFRGVFTMDLWGGYLIYQGYPRVRVFMDGRSDFYGAEFAKQYIKTMGVQSGWEQSLARYGVDTILLPPDAPLTGALRQSPAWSLTYDDGVALIFRARPAATPASIPAFGN
jgi:hypothetical protein